MCLERCPTCSADEDEDGDESMRLEDGIRTISAESEHP